MKWISYIMLIVMGALTILFRTGLLTQKQERVLSVLQLPKTSQFFNQNAQSYYDLAYVFSQKRFLGLVISSHYRGGSYALTYQNKAFMPYYLSESELLQFLAVNNLPTPTSRPCYPIYEHPVVFYILAAIAYFLFVCKPLFVCIPALLKRWAFEKELHKSLYPNYLRRR